MVVVVGSPVVGTRLGSCGPFVEGMRRHVGHVEGLSSEAVTAILDSPGHGVYLLPRHVPEGPTSEVPGSGRWVLVGVQPEDGCRGGEGVPAPASAGAGSLGGNLRGGTGRGRRIEDGPGRWWVLLDSGGLVAIWSETGGNGIEERPYAGRFGSFGYRSP